MISLFGPHEEHILAEATRTISLQNDTDHTAQDELWVGICTISYDRSLCKAFANPPPSAQVDADLIYVVPDMTHDDAYKYSPDVTSYPNHRFLACVPIISPKGIVIGPYTILDDKPRGSLVPDHSNFLTNMATTVMDYLITSRSRSQHLRGERMIVGLGSFLEEKGSLRTSWLDTTEELTSFNQDQDMEGQVNTQQQEKQRADDISQVMNQGNKQSSLPFRLSQFQNQRSDIFREHDNPSSLSYFNKSQDVKKRPRFSGRSKTNGLTKDKRTASQAEKKTHTTRVKDTFSRAANLARESLEVEGVSEEEIKTPKSFTPSELFWAKALVKLRWILVES